jgi:hypothetical protein
VAYGSGKYEEEKEIIFMPRKKSEVVRVRIPSKMKRFLDDMAKDTHTSTSDLMRYALFNFLKDQLGLDSEHAKRLKDFIFEED